MNRTQEIFEKIEEYLNKTLSGEELENFEKELLINVELQKEVEKHRSLHRVLSDKETLVFKEKVKRIGDEIKKEKTTPVINIFSTYFKIAASIIVILGLGTLLWNNFMGGNKAEDLYLAYYEPYPVEDVTRGEVVNESRVITDMYSRKEYSKAIPEFKKLIEFSVDEQYIIYLGNCFLNVNKEKQAIQEFEKITSNSRYFEDAQWYLALTYIKLSNTKKAKNILAKIIQYDGVYKKVAVNLNSELPE
ncbi:tetratricopeptide repeat protein [Aquimarina sp. MMG016]|uniref:tetratricopeptide repeat protein n=1 Tax=Aquimarina sp. MMG016 TaxID=2822690 RepID=UPI001B39F2A6|nr:tetratricopeptide repeat protein [Aquimarina sp. MMG016]MBQ4821401.1 hypothetical protein [Aquimarina sp. MMG016]